MTFGSASRINTRLLQSDKRRRIGRPGGFRVVFVCGLLAVGLPTTSLAKPINSHAELSQTRKTLEGELCVPEKNGYGPVDYTAPWAYLDSIGFRRDEKILSRVEIQHFTESVRRLVRGNAGGTLMGDLDYTLRAVPNHHPALYSVIELYFQVKGGRKLSASERRLLFPECYLQRAITYRPEDPMNYLLFGIYLHRRGLYEQALGLYRKAVGLNPGFAEAHYDMGLTLAAMEQWDDARKSAERAYALGYPLDGLKRILQRAGHWQEGGQEARKEARQETEPGTTEQE